MPLTDAQVAACEQINNLLENAPPARTHIVVYGREGIGKSYLAEQIRPNLPAGWTIQCNDALSGFVPAWSLRGAPPSYTNGLITSNVFIEDTNTDRYINIHMEQMGQVE